MRTCPRCGQSGLHQVFIKNIKEHAVLCEECDALWPQKHWPTSEPFVDFDTFMKTKGSRGLWEHVEITEDLDSP